MLKKGLNTYFHSAFIPKLYDYFIRRDGSNLLGSTRGEGESLKINIFSIVFEGTYDEHQSLVLDERSKNLRAQLFGGILSEDNLREVTEDFKEQV